MSQAVSPVMWYVASQQANMWLLSAVVKNHVTKFTQFIVLVIKSLLNSESILLLAFLLKKLKKRKRTMHVLPILSVP